jgi:hypothetical protein
MEQSNLTYFWMTIFSALLLVFIIRLWLRARQSLPSLRPIAAYEEMPRRAAAAIESARPLHYAIGASGIGDRTTLTTLASLAIVYELLEKQAFSNQFPRVSVSDPISLAITQDIIRKAYELRLNYDNYHPHMAVWFPSTGRSLAVGAGASLLSAQEKASGNIFIGDFGSELAYIGTSSVRHGQFLISHSTRLESQAVAYAQSDATLIGEELFAGKAYLNRANRWEQSSVIVLDILRWLAIVAILLVALNNA